MVFHLVVPLHSYFLAMKAAVKRRGMFQYLQRFSEEKHLAWIKESLC